VKTTCILLIISGLLFAGCGEQNTVYSSYYGPMEKLANEAKANPNDKTALHKLEQYTTDWDYWNRDYAYRYLGQLAFQNIGDYRAELLPYFDKALKDSDYGYWFSSSR